MSISIFLSNLNPKYVEWLQSSEISVKKSAPYKSGPFTLRPQIRRLKKCCRTNFYEPFPKLPPMNLSFFISFFYPFQMIFGKKKNNSHKINFIWKFMQCNFKVPWNEVKRTRIFNGTSFLKVLKKILWPVK